MYVQRHTVTLETDGSGDATGYTERVSGVLSQIRYVKDDFVNGVDFTITVEDTGEVLWDQDNVDASATVAPRQATHSTLGVGALYAADGAAVLAPIAIAYSRIKVVVANGGATKSGTFHFTLV